MTGAIPITFAVGSNGRLCQPVIQFFAHGDHGTPVLPLRAMDGQTQVLLPALHSPDSSPHVGSNLFPRVEYRSDWHGIGMRWLCRSRSIGTVRAHDHDVAVSMARVKPDVEQGRRCGMVRYYTAYDAVREDRFDGCLTTDRAGLKHWPSTSSGIARPFREYPRRMLIAENSMPPPPP